MIASTSMEAYREIEESGALTKMRLKALRGVYELKECTGAELDQWGMTDQSFGHLHKRILELHKCRVIQRTGSRKCRVTGKRATTWAPTGTMPVFVAERPREKRSTLEAENQTLRARVAELEGQLARERRTSRGQQDLFATPTPNSNPLGVTP